MSVCSASAAQDVQRPDASMHQSQPPAKVARYAQSIMHRYDLNGDSHLDESEWRRMSGDPAIIDRDGDQTLTLLELEWHILGYARAQTKRRPVAAEDGLVGEDSGDGTRTASNGESAVPEGDSAGEVPAPETTASPVRRDTRYVVRPSRGLGNLPGWFLSRDADGDGQLTLREFTAESSGRLREFERLDQNRDGVITPREATTPAAAPESAPVR